MANVTIYAEGLVVCSVCSDGSLEETLAAVNAMNPTGLDHGWVLSQEPEFRDGAPNPCPCNTEPETRKHYLLEC